MKKSKISLLICIISICICLIACKNKCENHEYDNNCDAICNLCGEDRDVEGHSLIFHELVEATCTVEGKKEYYECHLCGNYFTDEDANEVIEYDDLAIPKKEHIDQNEDYICDHSCGKVFLEKETLLQIIQNTMSSNKVTIKEYYIPGARNILYYFDDNLLYINDDYSGEKYYHTLEDVTYLFTKLEEWSKEITTDVINYNVSYIFENIHNIAIASELSAYNCDYGFFEGKAMLEYTNSLGALVKVKLNHDGTLLEGIYICDETNNIIYMYEMIYGEDNEILSSFEIINNCIEEKHILDTSIGITYTWSEDYNEINAVGYCVHCKEELHETVTTTYLEGVVSANFTSQYFEDQSVDLTDTLNMTAGELKKSLMKLVNEGETDIDVELQKDVSLEMFDAIKEGLVNAEEGTINLTLSGVESIPYSAFPLQPDPEDNFNSIKSIYLSDATSIGERAFESCCYLEVVDAPKVITVGKYAFMCCDYLYLINLPLAETIGESAFDGCSGLENVDLPSTKILGISAFSNCQKLISINIPNVTTIGENAFTYCKFEEIYLPKVTSIDSYAFMGMTKLRKITFGMPLTIIGNEIFYSPNNYYKVDTTQIDLVFVKGQKDFTGDNTNGWTITEDDIPTGENSEFLGYTFKSIIINHGEYLVTNANEILDAIEKINTDDYTVIKLMNDIEIEGIVDEMVGYPRYAILIESGNITIDLNGYQLSATNDPNSIIQIGADDEEICNAIVTIEDNSINQSGKIYATYMGIYNNGGTVIFNSGTIEVNNTNGDWIASGIEFNSGSVTMNGGSIIVNNIAEDWVTSGIYGTGSGGTFIMNGGYISVNSPFTKALCLYGTSYINGGIIECNGDHIYGKATFYLGTNEEGVGATFVGGIKSFYTLNSLLKLTDGVGYFDANGNSIEITDDIKEIIDKGDITIKKIN